MTITDDTRLRAVVPTMNFLKEQGAAVAIATHIGRPKGEPDPKFSVAPVVGRLSELLDTDVAGPGGSQTAFEMHGLRGGSRHRARRGYSEGDRTPRSGPSTVERKSSLDGVGPEAERDKRADSAVVPRRS